jgi:hypothetical protein
MWAVMVAKSWKSFELIPRDNPYPFPVSIASPGPDEPQWFIPIFATLKAAEAWSEGQYPIWQLANIKSQEGEK